MKITNVVALQLRVRNIENIFVAVIADSSELASAMPSLLEGVGALASNVTIFHDFDSTNQVLPNSKHICTGLYSTFYHDCSGQLLTCFDGYYA